MLFQPTSQKGPGVPGAEVRRSQQQLSEAEENWQAQARAVRGFASEPEYFFGGSSGQKHIEPKAFGCELQRSAPKKSWDQSRVGKAGRVRMDLFVADSCAILPIRRRRFAPFLPCLLCQSLLAVVVIRSS